MTTEPRYSIVLHQYLGPITPFSILRTPKKKPYPEDLNLTHHTQSFIRNFTWFFSERLDMRLLKRLDPLETLDDTKKLMHNTVRAVYRQEHDSGLRGFSQRRKCFLKG